MSVFSPDGLQGYSCWNFKAVLTATDRALANDMLSITKAPQSPLCKDVVTKQLN